MPKATVHKNHSAMTGEDQIRATRQIIAVQSESKPHSVKQSTHRHLRRGVLLADP
jgi:hypothetical protein